MESCCIDFFYHLLSPSINHSESHPCVNNLFLLLLSSIPLFHNLFIHLSVVGCLDYFHFWSISAFMNSDGNPVIAFNKTEVKELTEVAEPRFTTTPVAALCSFSSGSLPSPCHFIFLLGLKLNWNCTLLLLSFQILCSDCIEHRRPRCFVLKQLLRSECTWLGG